MRNAILMIALALSAVATSLGYSIKDGNNMSELVEDNIEALNQEEEVDYPCIRRQNSKCIEWYVESNGESGVNEYSHYVNYMEVEGE